MFARAKQESVLSNNISPGASLLTLTPSVLVLVEDTSSLVNNKPLSTNRFALNKIEVFSETRRVPPRFLSRTPVWEPLPYYNDGSHTIIISFNNI